MIRHHRRTRIVVAATCFADADPAIRIGVSLAEFLDGDIKAMLIEDEAVLHSAALPFARAFHATGRSSLPVTSNDMRSAYLRDARRIEGRLADATRRSMVSWSFERCTGRARAMMDQAAASGDLVLVGHHQRRADFREIVLLDSSEPPQEELVGLGIQMARESGAMLHLFTASPVQHAGIGATSELPRRPVSGRSRIVQENARDREKFLSHITDTCLLYTSPSPRDRG